MTVSMCSPIVRTDGEEKYILCLNAFPRRRPLRESCYDMRKKGRETARRAVTL